MKKRKHLPTDPNQVLVIDILFNGVYIEVYRIRFPAPSAAVNGLTPKYKTLSPVILVTAAKPIACTGLKIIIKIYYKFFY